MAEVGATGVAAWVEAGFFFGCFAGRFEVALPDIEAACASVSALVAGDDDALLLLVLGAVPHRLQ